MREIPIIFNRRKKGGGNLLEFDAANTTVEVGTLSNVIGGDWAVTRSTTGDYLDSDDVEKTAAINTPRIDYENGIAKVLVEPEKTNVILWSDNLDGNNWTHSNTTRDANAIASPDGNVNATRLNDNTTSGVHRLSASRTLTAEDYTFSCFIKNDDVGYIAMYITTALVGIWINAATGQIVSTDFGANSPISSGVIDYGNGWYRYWFKFAATAASHETRYFLSQDGIATSYVGVPEGLYLRGVQLEKGDLTSRILTASTSTTAPRGAEVASNAVPAGATQSETWINGVSQGVVGVTAGNTFNMVNNTTKIIMN